ncbi:Hsp20/alpha crystallin family protein [Horticoccus luteus]|uniref:Hsp20/alpha crystallin family protein n=1 Tax=Horticoccus luteus TaxID=2862869 RepID=A0A8F9XL18_9BACT|nr:Hsp20/alpha crystallin family protein [Horticoccus luteus]QYM78609.1 Hsp20/alpha crystallin family protein [Horticoccus luteus]
MRITQYAYPTSRALSPYALRSPWSGLENEIDRLFDSALTTLGNASNSNRFPVDLYEDKDNTYVRAELPGFARENIHVEMVEGYLTINAERKSAADGNDAESFNVTRSVNIPEDVHADKVSATYENGILTVTLPKREEAKPRKISVEVK